MLIYIFTLVNIQIFFFVHTHLNFQYFAMVFIIFELKRYLWKSKHMLLVVKYCCYIPFTDSAYRKVIEQNIHSKLALWLGL